LSAIPQTLPASFRLGDAVRLLRRGADLSSPEGRSRERIRRVLLTGLAAGLAKAMGLAATLLTIPVTAPYLGPERFGLFMTLGAVPLVMSFSDFGIGNGLLTELAKAAGAEQRERARTLVSSASYMLLAIGALAIALAGAACAWLPWARILRVVEQRAALETAPALFVFAVATAVSMPLGVVQRVQQGFQEGYRANLWLALGNLLGLGLLLAFVRLGLGLPWLVAAIAGGPVIAGTLNWVVEFRWRYCWLAPRFRQAEWSSAREILGTGLMIFSSQAGAVALLSCPMFLLAHTAGAASVAPFSALQRMYSVFIVASSMLMTPLWPAYSEAFARGDFSWLRSTFRKSLMVNAAIAGLPILALALSAGWLAPFISRGTLHATRQLALATAALSFLVATRHTVSMMVNGCGYLRRTAVTFPLAAVAAVCYVWWPGRPLADYTVPLWVAAAESMVLVALSRDAAHVLRKTRPVSSSSREEAYV